MKKQILVLVLAVLSGVGLPQKVNGQTHGQTVLDEASWIDNHNFQGGGGYDVSKETGDEYHPWVNTTTEDGWFSYDLSLEKADLSEPLYLACHFNAGDFGRRRTRILIDGELYKDGLFRAVQWKDKFYFWQYALIPAKFWRNADGTLKKDKLTIRFEGTRNESGQFEYSKGGKGVSLVQGGEYSFRCNDWETGDGVRVPQGNISYDEGANSLHLATRGTQNDVCLRIKMDFNGMVLASHKYMVVCGKGLETSAPANSQLWWLNGRNVAKADYPMFQTTLEDGTSFVVWDVMRTQVSGNMGGFVFTLSRFGSDNTTLFGLTSSRDDKTADITDISFYSLTGIAEKYPVLAEAMKISRLDEEAGSSMIMGSELVSVKRTLKPFVWNTFCVPFDMDATALAANDITEVRMLTGAEVNKDSYTLTFDEQAEVKAGVPYIVQVGEAVAGLNLDGMSLSENTLPGETVVDGVTMKGNFAKTEISGGEFFIRNNMFYKADRTVTVKGFRAYVEEPVQVKGVNRMLIDIDGEVTDVGEVLAEKKGNGQVDVFSLAGIRIKKGVRMQDALDGLPKGIYIVNGEKMMK